MADNTLSAGVARVDITPPVGFRMQGLMRRIEPSVGIESPLTATALVLADDHTKIAVIDCDLVGLDLPLANEVRQTVADRVGTPTGHVTVACTHTHNGPSTFRTGLAGPHDVAPRPGEIAALDPYIADLVDKLAGVASLADGRRRPARAGAGSGEAGVAINREEMLEDGRVFVGRNPGGVTDHSVDLLRIDDLEGNAIAAVACYAAHPVVIGLNSRLISPDYPGVVRRIVEQTTGAMCLFLTGAAGNQATIEFLQDDWSEIERIGGVVGSEAAKTFFRIVTRPHEVVRQLTESLSNLVVYSKEYRDGPTHDTLMAASRTVSVPLQLLPSLEQEALTFEIVGYRLDDFALMAMPGEPFVEIALGVKARSKATHTMFAGYGNGNVAYWPTPETIAQGGMAVEASVKAYNNSAPPTAPTVDILVGEFGKLLSDLGL